MAKLLTKKKKESLLKRFNVDKVRLEVFSRKLEDAILDWKQLAKDLGVKPHYDPERKMYLLKDRYGYDSCFCGPGRTPENCIEYIKIRLCESAKWNKFNAMVCKLFPYATIYEQAGRWWIQDDSRQVGCHTVLEAYSAEDLMDQFTNGLQLEKL